MYVICTAASRTCPFIRFYLRYIWVFSSSFSIKRVWRLVAHCQLWACNAHINHHCREPADAPRAVICFGYLLSYLYEVLGLSQCVTIIPTHSPNISSLRRSVSARALAVYTRAPCDIFLSNSWIGFNFLVDQRLSFRHLDLGWSKHATACVSVSLGF